MYLYFDESGDFAFPDERYDAYVQAGLICPDSYLGEMTATVEQMCTELAVEELHGAELAIEHLLPICGYIKESALSVLAQVTDTNAMTDHQITEHRLAQAARLRENLDQWKEASGESEEIETFYWRQINLAGLPQRVTNSEWVQGDLLIGLIHAAVFKSIVRYMDDEWRDDFWDFRFILDGKLPNKLAAGEKVLDAVLMPALGRNRYEFVTPTTWREDPVHPFEETFGEAEDRVSLNRLFRHGLQFESSTDHAGLQLVDVVAYVTRKVIVEPSNSGAYAAYSLIREKLRTERAGQALKLVRYRTGQDNIDQDRYGRVL